MTRNAEAGFRRAPAFAVCLSVIASAHGATSAPRDPSVSILVTTGRPRAAASTVGLDAARSGFVRTLLPLDPATTWRVRLPGTPVGAPVVDGRRRAVIATSSGRVVQLGPRGQIEWERSAPGDIAVSPAIGNDGTRYAITTAATLVAWSPEGALRFEAALSSTAPPTANLLPLSDGTLLVPIGREVLQVGSDGERHALAALPEDPLEVFETGSSWVALTRPGTVYAWSPFRAPERIGSVGGRPSRSAVIAGRLLASLVEDRRLVALDLDTRQTRLLVENAPSAAVAQHREGFVVVAADGSLSVIATGGGVRSASSLWANAPVQGRTTQPPTLLNDARGVIAFSEPSRGVALVDTAGVVRWVDPSPCPRPSGLAPTGERSIIVVCEDGTAALLTGRESAAPLKP